MGRGTKKKHVKKSLAKRIEKWEEAVKAKPKHEQHKPGSMSGRK